MKKELVGSIDRITEQTACIILNDDEHQLFTDYEPLPFLGLKCGCAATDSN